MTNAGQGVREAPIEKKEFGKMAPSSYAADYIEYLNRQGKYISTQGSEALKMETAPAPEVPSRSVQRREERKQRELTQLAPVTTRKIVTTSVLLRSTIILLIIGALLIASVWMGAKATAIKYSINSLTKENVQLQDQVTMLGIQIEGAVSFESIEEYATKNLKMVYPKKNQCQYIDDDAEVKEGLVKAIREKAYSN